MGMGINYGNFDQLRGVIHDRSGTVDGPLLFAMHFCRGREITARRINKEDLSATIIGQIRLASSYTTIVNPAFIQTFGALCGLLQHAANHPDSLWIADRTLEFLQESRQHRPVTDIWRYEVHACDLIDWVEKIVREQRAPEEPMMPETLNRFLQIAVCRFI